MMDLDQLSALPPGTLLAHPNNIVMPYDEYALRMDMTSPDQYWFVINTKHGGGYTGGVELATWLIAYSPPTLVEE